MLIAQSPIISFLADWLLAAVALFTIANPIEALPLFVDLTSTKSGDFRARVAFKASLLAAILMGLSLFLGQALLRLFGVSPEAVLVAGGLVVGALGFPMLITGRVKFHAPETPDDGTSDHALVPLAFPGICGPGAIAALIAGASYIQALATSQAQVRGYAVALAAIALVSVVAWVILRLSAPIARRLGVEGLDALCRLMGLLLIVIGVQLLADGVRGFVRDRTPGPEEGPAAQLVPSAPESQPEPTHDSQ